MGEEVVRERRVVVVVVVVVALEGLARDGVGDLAAEGDVGEGVGDGEIEAVDALLLHLPVLLPLLPLPSKLRANTPVSPPHAPPGSMPGDLLRATRPTQALGP